MTTNGPYQPDESGLYTMPNTDGPARIFYDDRVIRYTAEEAMSEHRPEVPRMTGHRLEMFWATVVAIDAYEEARMVREGIVEENPSLGPTRLVEAELKRRGHETVPHYLLYERSYPDQIDHALAYVQGGYADGAADAGDVAHIGRAKIGLDGAGRTTKFDMGATAGADPEEWMDLYEALAVEPEPTMTELRKHVQEFGAESALFREWDQIDEDFKAVELGSGRRLAMAWSAEGRGRVLTTHYGPEGLEVLRAEDEQATVEQYTAAQVAATSERSTGLGMGTA